MRPPGVAGVRRPDEPTLGECDPPLHAAARVGVSRPRAMGSPPAMSATDYARRLVAVAIATPLEAELAARGPGGFRAAQGHLRRLVQVGEIERDDVDMPGRITRDAAVEQTSANYRQMIGVYATAATETSPSWSARAELGS